MEAGELQEAYFSSVKYWSLRATVEGSSSVVYPLVSPPDSSGWFTTAATQKALVKPVDHQTNCRAQERDLPRASPVPVHELLKERS